MLVIVAAACTGYRSAGVMAAISTGVWFDFFLTAPYLTFRVASAADVETLVVLIALGVVISKIIQWGRRYQFELRDRDAYLQALLAISDAGGRRGQRALDAVSSHLVAMLDLDACTWVNWSTPMPPHSTGMDRSAITAGGFPSTPRGCRPSPLWPCRYDLRTATLPGSC